jgi:hypothetical protein
MEKVGCFGVGILLLLLGIAVIFGVLYLFGTLLYRLETGRWPWNSYDSCLNEVLLNGISVALVLTLLGIVLYPAASILSDLGCWALKAGR